MEEKKVMVSFEEAVKAIGLGEAEAVVLYLAQYNHLPPGAKIPIYELSRAHHNFPSIIQAPHRKLLMRVMQKQAAEEKSFEGWKIIYRYCVESSSVNVRSNILKQARECAEIFEQWQWLHSESVIQHDQQGQDIASKQMLFTAQTWADWKILADLDLDAKTKQDVVERLVTLSKTPYEKGIAAKYFPEQRASILREIVESMEAGFDEWRELHTLIEYQDLAFSRMLWKAKTVDNWSYLMLIAYEAQADQVIGIFPQIEASLEELAQLYGYYPEADKLILERMTNTKEGVFRALYLLILQSCESDIDPEKQRKQREALIQAAQFIAE